MNEIKTANVIIKNFVTIKINKINKNFFSIEIINFLRLKGLFKKNEMVLNVPANYRSIEFATKSKRPYTISIQMRT